MMLPSFREKIKLVTREGLLNKGLFLLMLIGLHYALAKGIANQRVMPLIALFGLAGYAVLIPLRLKFVLLILAALLPISFGNLGPIPAFLWVEWMGPLLFGVMFYYVLIGGKRVIPSNSILFTSSVAIIGIWAIIQYCQHPVLAEKLMGVSSQEGGLRSYYRIFVGACVFFVGLWFSKYAVESEIFWKRVLLFLLIVSCCLGILKVFSYFLHFDIPFVYGTFRYDVRFGLSKYGGGAFRIGGLSEVATIGLGALLALRIRKPFTLVDVTLFSFFSIILFSSGGRASTIGVLAALTTYSIIFNPKQLGWMLGGSILLICCILVLSSLDIFSGQLNRLFAFEGGLAVQAKYRYITFQLMWKEFLENPLFGRGIGYVASGSIGTKSFVYSQLKTGGHGSYLSILSIFGLGGAYFMVIMLFGSILKGTRLVMAKMPLDPVSQDRLTMVVFIVLIFIVKSFEYIVSGKGYQDMSLYLMAGILAGIYSIEGSTYEQT